MLGRFSFFAAALLAGAGLQAGPVICVSGGTLASYESLASTGCLVGPLIVRDFSFSVVSGSGSVTDTSIFVTPTHSAPNVWGLNFASSGFAVTGAGSVKYLVAYTWDPTDDIQSLDDLMDPPLATPPGFAQVSTSGCLEADFSAAVCPTSTTSVSVIQDGISPVLSSSASFAPVAILGLHNTIDLEGKTTGSASFDSFTNELTIVPEPASRLGCVIFLILLSLRLWRDRTRLHS